MSLQPHAGDCYDAFISYSHAADSKLARALRDALQRFATSWSPWSLVNPVRSLRVFRDESALSADPALWPAIERALAASEWFVLLASVDAARSSWIDKEVSFWCANKSRERMLLVLSDGEIVWDPDAEDFDWQVTTALPRRLAGSFAQEPLWLDLRWTKRQGRPDLGDPRFHDAVASIAAPLRGIPKDQLLGEDIRQHRRLRRWRNAAMATLSILLIGAIAAAEIARQQRNLAREREAEAVAERLRAEREAEIALARQLAEQSLRTRLQSIDRIELSLLLAVEAARRDGSLESAQALAQALALTPQRVNLFHHRWGAFQQDAMVLDLAYSPDGSLVASANEDGSIALWQVGGEQVWHQAISDERVRAIAFRPDGKMVATAGKDGTVGLWRVEDGEAVATFIHEAPATGLVLEPQGRYLATASEDGTARIWAVDSGDEIGRLSFGEGDLAEVQDVAFSPDGELVAAINEGGRACLWDLARRGESGCVFTEGLGLHLAFAPDSSMLATASENFAVVWDTATGERLYRFEHPDLLGDANMAHFLWLDDLAFHPDGRFLATASRDRTVRVWDLENGQEALRLDEAGPVNALAFSHDGRRLATATAVGTVRVWEMPSGRELFRIGQLSDSIVQALAFSPDGDRLAAANWRSEVGIWSLRSAIEGARLHHPDDVEKLAFSSDGRFVATAADDNIIRVWNTDGWTRLAELKRFNPKRLLFGEGGRTIFLESQEGGLEILSVGETLETHQLVARPRGDAILTPRFAFLERGGLFDIWKADRGDVVAEGLGRALPADTYALHSDPALLAVAYRGQDAIDIWDVTHGRQLGEIPIGSRVFRMTISPLGDRLAVVHGERREGAGRYDPLDYRVEVRSLPEGDRIAQYPLGRLEPVFMYFLHDGKRLFYATGDWQFPNDVHVLDPSHENTILTLNDVREVHTLRVAPDGEHIAITDRDRVRVWNIETGRAVAQLPATGSINSLGFSPDGRFLATASGDDDLTLWRWRLDDLIDQACRHLTRNLTHREWQDFLPVTPYRPTCPDLPAEHAAGAEGT